MYYLKFKKEKIDLCTPTSKYIRRKEKKEFVFENGSCSMVVYFMSIEKSVF